MNLIEKINKKLVKNKEGKVKLTALTTAISILATGVLPSTSLLNEEKNLAASKEVVLDMLTENLEEEITNVEVERYEAKNKAVETKKETKKESINIGNYSGNSITEALKQAGYDSSYASRKKIAKQYGIKNYDKSVEKNIELLNALKKEAKKIKADNKKTNHKYKLIKQKYKNNKNGTHTIIKDYKCKDCDKKKTKKVNKKHKFDNEIVVVNDEQEIHTCECGEEKYVNHIYTEWKKDENGITESRICKTCGHEISRVRAKLLEELVEGVDYIKTVNYKDNGDGTHSVKTKYKWIKSSGSLTMITKSSHDKKENWESLNDETEINRCVCGYYETRSHDYDTAKDNGNGTESLQCKNCKNIMTRKKQQTITPSNPFMPSYPTPDSDISKHEHLWVKSGDSYYQTTESEHILKQDYKCSNSTCQETKTVTISKENHLLVNWVPNQDGKTEKSICEKCGKTVIREIEKHNHKFNKIDEKITINADGTHIRTTIYECPEDKEQKTETKIENCTFETNFKQAAESDKHIKIETCTVCKDKKETEMSCIPNGNILVEVIDGVIYEYQICKDCGRKCNYQLHEKHTEAPKDLVYTLDHANSDGTHELTATYNCDLCGEEITLNKTEACDYSNSKITYEQLPGGNFTVNNIHNVLQTCDVCGETSKKEEACTPVGDMQYMTHLSQVYEFYYCEDCGYRCEQVPHFKHNYPENWSQHNESEHRKECPCQTSITGDDRMVSEPHHVEYKDGNLVCKDCGYVTTNIAEHEHAKDGMNLMDLVMSPYYNHLIDKGQQKNPVPSPYGYCSRYDLRCPTCGVVYYIKYDHDFKDGKCTRGYCDHIADPDYGIDTTELEEVNLEDLVEQVPIEDLVEVELTPEEVVTTSPSAIETTPVENAEVTTSSAIQAKKLVKTR